MIVKKQIQNNGGYDKSGPFLATTALEDFWDISRPIVFLGEWCRRYSRRSFWEPLEGEVIPCPWKDGQKLHDAYYYINNVYECLLPLLGSVLNTIHGEKHSNRYWRIVIGPWLFHYIDVLYDRYMSLCMALNQYPDFTAIGLSEECFVVPRDTMEFLNLVEDDPYNLQIYTRILTMLGKECRKKTIDVFNKSISLSQKNLSLKGQAKQLSKHIINLAYNFMGKQKLIILSRSYFSHLVELKLFFKTAVKVKPLIKEPVELPLLPLNREVRSKLQDIGLGKREFESLIISMLPFDIPQCFIESYKIIENKAQRHYPPNPKAILSAVSWYFDEVFKHWVATAAEAGTKLIGIQHGGNYGIDVNMQAIDHELAITDRFYSWGWEQSTRFSKVIPMPATKLVGRKMISASNKKEGIFLVATGTRRYLYRLQNFNNYQYGDYIDWQLRFGYSLFPEIRDRMRVRLFQNDFGWDLWERWKDRYPEVSIEKWDIPFLKSLKNCRLFVCDHLSTVHAEALSANKPTILFWDPLIFTLNQEAMPYFDELRSARILHNTPEAAANTVNAVYNDVEAWWNEPDRQSVLKRFCKRFARTSPHAIDEWAKELNRIEKWAENDKRK